MGCRVGDWLGRGARTVGEVDVVVGAVVVAAGAGSATVWITWVTQARPTRTAGLTHGAHFTTGPGRTTCAGGWWRTLT